MLLQIMEEGRLTDNVGRVIDFKNTILIMTTNVGAETIIAPNDLSSVFTSGLRRETEVKYQDMKKKLLEVMGKVFRPEFLNRLDDIIVFRKLEHKDLKQIVEMELVKVSKRLKEKNLALTVTEEAKDFLIEKGSSLEMGARPLRRAVEQHMEDSMAEALLRGDFADKDTITVKVEGEDEEKKLVFEATSSKPQEPVAVAETPAS
jgi:ATP-dependent Clp protease ATP-binding subunit ClpC